MANINALKKIAWDEDGVEYGGRPAGIGTWDQNALTKSWPVGADGWVSHGLNVNSRPADGSSYFAQLLANAKKDPRAGAGGGSIERRGDEIGRGTKALDVLKSVAPTANQGSPNGAQITNDDLDKIRLDQARRAAAGLSSPGTAENDELRSALEAAGRSNHQSFINTGKVPLANPLKNPKLQELFNRLKLSPEQKKALPAIFGSMASVSAPGASVKKAQAKSDIWQSVRAAIDAAGRVDPKYKPLLATLIGGGVGAGTGALAGKLFGFGAGNGALTGLGLGALGGGASTVDWKSLAKALESKSAKKDDTPDVPDGYKSDGQ